MDKHWEAKIDESYLTKNMKMALFHLACTCKALRQALWPNMYLAFPMVWRIERDSGWLMADLLEQYR